MSLFGPKFVELESIHFPSRFDKLFLSGMDGKALDGELSFRPSVFLSRNDLDCLYSFANVKGHIQGRKELLEGLERRIEREKAEVHYEYAPMYKISRTGDNRYLFSQKSWNCSLTNYSFIYDVLSAHDTLDEAKDALATAVAKIKNGDVAHTTEEYRFNADGVEVPA